MSAVSVQVESGVLYVVSTPIGNLGDITPRAVSTLKAVDLIAAEDTRHSKRLTDYLGISTPMQSLHNFNERNRLESLLEKLASGKSVALISDAGTPLISDPGYHLVHEARVKGIKIVPVPGACALTVALSVAGLPTDRFCFEGFLPAKSGNRKKALEKLKQEHRTLVFYEAPHRIIECLQSMQDVFGVERQGVIARELTKQYESVYSGSILQLLEQIQSHADHQRGEFVVMVHGAEQQKEREISTEIEHMLVVLMEELPLKKAAALVSRMTGVKKNKLYEVGLGL